MRIYGYFQSSQRTWKLRVRNTGADLIFVCGFLFRVVNFLSVAASLCLQYARPGPEEPEVAPDEAPEETPEVRELRVEVVLEPEWFSSSESDSTVLTDVFRGWYDFL